MKSLRKIIALCLCLVLTISLFSVLFCVYAADVSSSQIKVQIDSIISYKLKYESVSSVKSLISDVLPNQAGIGAEWYVLSLKQFDPSLDFTRYRESLKSYVSSENSSNATEKEKFALLLALTGYSGSYITDVISSSTGKLGIMSYIYSLHLLNLGYTSSSVSKQSVISELLSRQLSDGGWAISGKYGDVDVTAMTLQALSQNTSDKKVRSAVDSALAFLSSRLSDSCEYSSYGAINSESTSQTIIALSALGINICSDKRFVKNGRTLIDTLLSYKQSDSGYSHVKEKGTDAYATVQALMAFVSYYRYLCGKGSIYKFSVQLPSVPSATQATSVNMTTTKQPSTHQQTTAATTSKPASTTKEVTKHVTSNTETSKRTNGETEHKSGGLFGGLDLFGLLSTTRSETTSAASESVSDYESQSVPETSVSSTSVSASLSSSFEETSSVTQTVLTSETVSEETVTQPYYESTTLLSETEKADNIIQQDKNTPPVIAIAAVILISGCAAFAVIYKRRH